MMILEIILILTWTVERIRWKHPKTAICSSMEEVTKTESPKQNSAWA